MGQDLYFVNSGHVLIGRQGADNRLYRAVDDGKFEAVPGAAGATWDTYGMGVLAGDPDDDGDGGFVDMTRRQGSAIPAGAPAPPTSITTAMAISTSSSPITSTSTWPRIPGAAAAT
jgi:hypothetical protein